MYIEGIPWSGPPQALAQRAQFNGGKRQAAQPAQASTVSRTQQKPNS
jgi:hypothetical protein